ncbi:hypothetical protein CISG_05640 [Coccidioides immitis RMSCC 3703]|uniref:Uncharacterized protein n=1 Tax=Coccidioides immitis RMSCC 3703 TaxID=454286 RepID=A0A0J8TSP9_COCIT|nr:hypothetical protein CISG_05640 [Coccidioides immitis RMSCC 3703]
MPALTTTAQESSAQLRPRTTSPPPIFNPTPRKSHDRSSLSNAFVWASEANGENGHVDTTSSEFFMTNLKTGSFQSLPHTNKSVVSSHGRERSHSRNGSLLSLGAGDRGEVHKDHHHPHHPHHHHLHHQQQQQHARHSLANGIDAQVDRPYRPLCRTAHVLYLPQPVLNPC